MEHNSVGFTKAAKPDQVEQLLLNQLQGSSVTDFDLYIDIGTEELVLYAPAPYAWTTSEISRLADKGYGKMYFNKSEEAKFFAYQKVVSIKTIDESRPPAQRLLDITDVAAELTRILYEYPLTTSALEKGRDIAKNLVRCVAEDLSCVQALSLLKNHDYYTYYHSARVGAYSLAVALKLSMSDSKQLEDLALGSILHDIGKSQVGLPILNKQGKLSPTEWELMKKHPDFGDGMLDISQLGIVPRQIVKHHHERIDGKGYPHGLYNNELLDEVKIASFADVFDALTTNRPYSRAKSRFEALDFIRFNLLEALYKDAYRAMVEILTTSSESGKEIRPAI